MNIRAILLDMDGTLLGRSQVAVSVRNMEALARAMEKGVAVIPCTGRVFDMMPPQLLTMEGLRYYITSHGAAAYDRLEKKNIYEDTIPADEAERLMEMLEGRGLYNEIAARNTIWLEKAIADTLEAQPVPEHHVWYMRDRCYTAVEKPSEYFRKHGVRVEKMNLYNIPAQMQQSVYDAVTATGFICHKIRAVEAVLARLGVGFEETMALGDSSSDEAILRKSALGVAMGNAPEKIKACANDVTGLNTEDGVALALEKYLL